MIEYKIFGGNFYPIHVADRNEARSEALHLYVLFGWKGTLFVEADNDQFSLYRDNRGTVVYSNTTPPPTPPDAPELARLRDENAKLREALTQLCQMAMQPAYFAVAKPLPDHAISIHVDASRRLLEAKP